MDRSTSNHVVLALLVICSALLVAPALGGTPGEIVSWGRSSEGQVSQTPAGTGYTAVAAGWGHSLALRADGSIVSWGDDAEGQVSDTPAGTGYTAVAAGYAHSVALRADGSIVSWGWDGLGQVSDTPAGTGYTAVAAGSGHSLALRADGSIVSWGGYGYGQVSDTPAGTGYTAVAAGSGHSLALRADGSIVSWGGDGWGVVSDTPAGTGYTAVAAGAGHSLALRADGSIVSWGINDGSLGYDYGQVSDTPAGTGYTAIAAGAGAYHSVALKADGSIVSWGNNEYGQVSNTPAGTGYTAVAAGFYHSVALLRPLVPHFSATPLVGIAPLTVQFTDETTGGQPLSWSWDFGDGGHSPLTNPVHTYAERGRYDVSLTVTNAVSGSRSVTRKDCILVLTPLIVNFTAAPRIGYAPLAVQFSDKTTGNPTGWEWFFGDGGTSTAQNPLHAYANPGTYRVSLTASKTGGSNTTSKYNYVYALPLTGPFTIQAEDYDEGGEGIAYSDTTPGNQGHAYRNDNVDIETFGVMSVGYVIAQIRNDEWTRYTVPSAAVQDHDYKLTLRVSTRTTGEQVTVEVDGSDKVTVDLPNTGTLSDYTDVTTEIRLHPGTNTIRFIYDGEYTNFDYFTLDPGQIVPLQPVPGAPNAPTDLHLDGTYDDVNGNGRADFADIVLYFNQMSWIAANEPVPAFDYNGNGRIDFADVVWLFNHL